MAFIDKVKFSYFFIKGSRLLREENTLDALLYFNKASRCKHKDYDLYAYKGLCEFLLHKYENAILSYQEALPLIHKKHKLNKDEKDYLKYYILGNLILSLKILKKNENIGKYEQLYKNLTFNKVEISERILEDFPIES